MNWLRPAPAAKPVSDPQRVDSLYRHWRSVILWVCFAGYAIFYLCRRNIPMALPSMASELGYSKASLGLIESAGHASYGIGKFANGVLADRTNPRYFMALGLFLTALANIVFSTQSTLGVLVAIWAVNGWFQSMGFPPGARLLSHWFSPREHGWTWGIYGCSHQAGTALVSIAAGYLIIFGWRSVFVVPAVAAIAGAALLAMRLRDIPASMGLPPVEVYRNDAASAAAAAQLEEPMSTKEALLGFVLKNPAMWAIALANLFLYIARYGVNIWLPTYLSSERHVSIAAAGWITATFETGGVFGMLAAGRLSDSLFHARRGPVMALCMAGLSVAMYVFWRASTVPMYLAALAAGGFLVYGPLMLVSVAAAGIAGKKAAATAAGFCGFWGYMGATVSGAGLGKVVDAWGWQTGFATLIASSLLSAALFATTWNVKPRGLATASGGKSVLPGGVRIRN